MKPPSSNSNSSHSGLSTTARYPFKKHFLPEELRRYLIPTLEKLYKMDPEGLPFRQPVDPKMLGCMVSNCLFCTIIRRVWAKYGDFSVASTRTRC
jgi:hypothetical protein